MLSDAAKLYLRILLEYAEAFDGFQGELDDKFGPYETEAEQEASVEKRNAASEEIWKLLE